MGVHRRHTLGVDGSKADEGVWLYDAAGVAEVVKLTIFNVNTKPALGVQCNGTKIASGEKYTLVVRTRGGDAKAAPVELRRPVTAASAY